MARRIDRAAMFAATAPSASHGGGEIIPHPSVRGGVDVSRDGRGVPTQIAITMPLGRGETKPRRFSPGHGWLAASHLSEPFAHAAFEHLRDLSVRSRPSTMSGLENFFKFLSAAGMQGADLHDMDSLLFNQYAAWLKVDRRGHSVKTQSMGALKAAVARLRQMPRYANLLPVPSACEFPDSPWASATPGGGREALPLTGLARIEAACLREMAEVTGRIAQGDRLVEEGRLAIADGSDARSRRLDVVLATLADDFGGSPANLKRAHNRLYEAAKANGGVARLCGMLSPSARDLMPFVVMMAIRTAFNPESVLALELSSLRGSPLLGGSMELDARARVVGKKGRAGRDQVRTYPLDDTAMDNPVTIFRDVERITARPRRLAPVALADKLFLCRPERRADVAWLGDTAKGSHHVALSAFIADNRLPKFTLAQIRPTVSELVDLVSGGDIKAQQVALNHVSVDTTDGHYVSAAGRRRRTERLAEIVNRRERWVASGGLSDSRQPIPMGTGRAATTGFECFDPYDSPVTGQTPGKACAAWGECPTCPLASVNPRSPHALAHLVRLKAAIEAARARMTPQRWLSEWAPALEAIVGGWLPRFTDPGVFTAGEDVVLPPLDAIE